MQLDSLTLDHLRLESQYTMAVQCRRTVKQYRMSLHHVLQNLEDNRITAVDDLLGGLNRLNYTALDELADDKRFVQLGSHLLRQTALVHLQLRTNHDNRTCREVHTLTQQVLTETSLLAFQRVAQRFQRTVSLALDSGSLAAVVEQAVHSLLKHTFLVAENNVRSLDLNQSAKTVVTDDHTTVEVVEVRGSKSSTVQRNERTELRRSNRNNLQDHPLRVVPAL